MPSKIKYTENELKLMKEEYLKMRVSDFIKKYKISSSTAIMLFGHKERKRVIFNEEQRKEYMRNYHNNYYKKKGPPRRVGDNGEESVKLIMDKFGVSTFRANQALKNYTVTEILETGYLENGKIKAKDIIKIYR